MHNPAFHVNIHLTRASGEEPLPITGEATVRTMDLTGEPYVEVKFELGTSGMVLFVDQAAPAVALADVLDAASATLRSFAASLPPPTVHLVGPRSGRNMCGHYGLTTADMGAVTCAPCMKTYDDAFGVST